MLLLVSLGVAVESPFEIAERDDEAGPPVNEAKFEDVVLEERPKTVTLNESTTTTSSAHSTLETAAAIFSASL